MSFPREMIAKVRSLFQDPHGRTAAAPRLFLRQSWESLAGTINPRALRNALIATGGLLALILAGSRNLGDFDPALIAYLFACVFAVFGITYRYSVWLQRPPTRKYWERSLELMKTGDTREYLLELGKRFWQNFIQQKFIRNRGKARGYGHMLMAGGCTLAFAMTFPLVFGWIHFDLVPGSHHHYSMYVFGFETIAFPVKGVMAFLLFNGLNFSSILVIAGVMILMRRRLTHAGQIAIQTFEGDWLPLILLLAISVTGLGISLDYKFMDGKAHQFMAITHAMTVILFLIWMPFGKFYHIFQRPAQLGVAVYRKAGEKGPQAKCPHTGAEFTSQMQVDDLKEVTAELGFDFTRSDGTSHLDYSPRGKRALLAKAHLKAREESGSFFG